MPYGELLVDEHSSSEEMPYKFNGKELDEETGLYYYGARYMQPVASIWYGVDPLTEKYPTVSGYTYCLGNPIKLVDPDGNFPILINGHVSEDYERGSWRYWDKSIRETIKKRTGYYHSQFMYVDGDRGLWPSTRFDNGMQQGKADALKIYNRLKKSIGDDGKIHEQLQVFSHSRGSAFANGYMQGITAEIIILAAKDNVGFAYGTDHIIEYSVNLAPHQSNYINYPQSGTINVNISHFGDPLSGNDATGNVINVHSNTDIPGMDQHGNATYNKELDFTLGILERTKTNVKRHLQEEYKKWDKTHSRGINSKVE